MSMRLFKAGTLVKRDINNFTKTGFCYNIDFD